MAREVYPTEEFRAQAKYFVFVHIDGDAQKDVTSRFGVTGYPTLVFLTKDDAEVHRVVGYAPLHVLLQEFDKARQLGGG